MPRREAGHRRFARARAFFVARADDTSIVHAATALGPRDLFRRFWPFARPYRSWILVALVLAPVAPAIQTIEIVVFKRVVDDVLVPHDFGAFPKLALAYVLLGIALGTVSFANDYISTLVGERFVLDLRTHVFRHLQNLSLDFFERRRLGDVMARLTGDVSAIEDLVLSGLAAALTYGLRILFFAGMLFYLRWELALVSLAVTPLFAHVARKFARLRKEASREKRRRSGAISAVAEESLANAQVVQAFNRQELEVTRFRRESFGSFAAQMASTRLRAVYGPLIELIELSGVLLIVGLGTWELSRGRLTIGGLLAFLALLTQLYRPVRGLGRLSNRVASATAGAERIAELLDERPTIVERPDAGAIARARGAIDVRSIGFEYPEAHAPALEDVSFSVGPGELLAVVGPSGAGKSTLAKLLLRFYDPTEGQICLDGRDLRDLTLHSLRDQISVVFQETLVFDGTIRENVGYGRLGASDDEIEEAAEAADLASFVATLPDGYETRVGQKGRRLSGGQRQRLAIARAYLRGAPVLILDEPATGLDRQSAARVLRALRGLVSGRTTIVISHDLALVRDATEIVVLDGGRIVETGTHDELLAEDGLYTRLHLAHGLDSPEVVEA